MLLPPYKQCPLTFLKAILNGSKKALGLRKVVYVNFPRLKPFSVQKVLRLALEHEEIKKYLPEKEEIDGFYLSTLPLRDRKHNFSAGSANLMTI